MQEEEEDCLSFPVHRGEEADYAVFSESTTDLKDVEVNELSVNDFTQLSILYYDNHITLYNNEKIPFRLVRINKRLVVNEIQPPFSRKCDVDEEFFLINQPNTHPDDMHEKIRAHLAPLIAEEKRAYDTRYDKTKMVYRDTWRIKGSALNVKFFNLNTPLPSTLSISSRATIKRLPIGTNGLMLPPFSQVEMRKGYNVECPDGIVYFVSKNVLPLLDSK